MTKRNDGTPAYDMRPNFLLMGISTALLIALAVVLIVSWGESVLATVLAAVGALIAMALMVIEVRRISKDTSAGR